MRTSEPSTIESQFVSEGPLTRAAATPFQGARAARSLRTHRAKTWSHHTRTPLSHPNTIGVGCLERYAVRGMPIIFVDLVGYAAVQTIGARRPSGPSKRSHGAMSKVGHPTGTQEGLMTATDQLLANNEAYAVSFDNGHLRRLQRRR
jgi:hypothetical protein